MPEDRSSADEGGQRAGLWRGLQRLFGGPPAEDRLRDQLEGAIDRHEGDPAPDEEGDLSPLEREMVRNLLHFGEQDAGDVGVPRADIVAVEEGVSFDELVQAFAECGHSRLPVYRGALDTVVGMVHLKDVFQILAAGAERPAGIAGLTREPLYVPMARGALDLLADMRSSRVHLAIVLDEYAGTEGLVTIEDLIEEIVGAIEDEHDEAPVSLLVALDGGAWDADARVELDEVGEVVDARLAAADGDVDTLGGLAALLAGHVPAAGDCVDHPSGWKLEVLDADERRVNKLRLHPPAPAAEEPE